MVLFTRTFRIFKASIVTKTITKAMLSQWHIPYKEHNDRCRLFPASHHWSPAKALGDSELRQMRNYSCMVEVDLDYHWSSPRCCQIILVGHVIEGCWVLSGLPTASKLYLLCWVRAHFLSDYDLRNDPLIRRQ